MGKLIHIFFGVLMVLSTMAQPAADVDPQATPTVKAATKLARVGKPTTKPDGPVSTLPSRNVGASEMDSYVESIASIFLIRQRERDAFGQLQDPDAKPIPKIDTGPKKPGRPTPIPSIQFTEIIQKIVVTTIMPGEQRFLVGTRSIKRGDQLPLSFRGRQIRVQVTEVTSRQIGFRNIDTGEVAFRKLDMLPAGMTPGSRGISAPGMIPDKADAPIELESDNLAPGNTAP